MYRVAGIVALVDRYTPYVLDSRHRHPALRGEGRSDDDGPPPRSRPRSPDLCRDMAAQGGIHRLEEHLGASEQAGSAPSTQSSVLFVQYPAPKVNRAHAHGTRRHACTGGEQDPGVVTLLTEGGSTVPCAGEVIRQDGDTLPRDVAKCHAPPFR